MPNIIQNTFREYVLVGGVPKKVTIGLGSITAIESRTASDETDILDRWQGLLCGRDLHADPDRLADGCRIALADYGTGQEVAPWQSSN